MRNDLGDWIRHRLRKGIGEQGTEAQRILGGCGVDIPELRNQWSDQRNAQLSVRSCKPSCNGICNPPLIPIFRCASSAEKGVRHCPSTAGGLRDL